MLSQTAEYALRTVLYIARRKPGEGPVSADEIAEALGIPRNYLSKTLHRLAQERILASTRGKGGGFVLARPAEALRLLDVVGLFDRVEAAPQCLLGQPVCSDRTACTAHAQWKEVAGQVARFFRETTIADLLAEAAASGKALGRHAPR